MEDKVYCALWNTGGCDWCQEGVHVENFSRLKNGGVESNQILREKDICIMVSPIML